MSSRSSLPTVEMLENLLKTSSLSQAVFLQTSVRSSAMWVFLDIAPRDVPHDSSALYKDLELPLNCYCSPRGLAHRCPARPRLHTQGPPDEAQTEEPHVTDIRGKLWTSKAVCLHMYRHQNSITNGKRHRKKNVEMVVSV